MRCKFVLLLYFFILRAFFGFAQDQPYRFVILADTQLGMHAGDQNFEQEKANYEFVVAAINRWKPGFVIVLGDLVNKTGSMEQIREFLRITRTIDPFIPVYYVAGNHDIGPAPTPETLALYRKIFGRDYYYFRAGPLYGIVLNSSLICEPKNVLEEYRAQNAWLKKELEAAKASGAQHVIVFQHHPYFVSDPGESTQWGSIPLKQRKPVLELLHQYGVHYVFAGHVHKSFAAKDGDLEMVACGPVSMPLGEDRSGLCVVTITAGVLQHQFYDFGRMPNRLDTKKELTGESGKRANLGRQRVRLIASHNPVR